MKEEHQKNIQSNTLPNVPFKAVIFDMDGTLIASTQADFLAWKKLFWEHQIELTFENYYPLLGLKSGDVIKSKLHLQGAAMDEALQKKLHYFKEAATTHGLQSIPFAEALIKNIRQYPVKLALATSSRRPKMEMVMKQTGLLNYFDVIVTGEEVSNGKPAPDIFISAAEKLSVPAHECIIFEDAASGVQAAKNAGMKCVAITTTHHAMDLEQADVVINSFKDLDFPDLCKTLSNKS